MKKFLQLTFLAASMAGFSQTLPVPTTSLVAFYGLNGNGADGSGNGITLNNSAATANTDRFNNTASSMYFSGTGSTCLYITNGSVLNMANSNLTVSFWYNSTNNADAGVIDNSQATTANGWGIDVLNGRFRFLGGGNLTGPIFEPDGLWHHIAFVKYGTKGVFYKDNIATDSSIFMTSLTAPTTAVQFNVGRRNNFTSYLQTTKLDDIAIYNRALTSQEISNIATYNGYVPLPPLSLSVPANGLMAHYPFHYGVLSDYGTYNAAKTLINSNNALASLDRFNNPTSSYHFDGTNWLQLNDGGVLGVSGASVSISFWYKSSSTAYAGLVDNSQVATANGYGIDNFGSANLRFLGGGNFSAAGYNADGQWHHVVFTKSGSLGIFYKDGVVTGTINTMTNLTLQSAVTPFTIGSRNNFTSFFNGDIDDVSIYNRTLSSTEVDQMYHYNNWPTTTTGLLTNEKNENFIIYPNPTNGVFSISSMSITKDNSKLQIINSLGEIILDKNIVSENETFNLNNYNSGIYFIKIYSNHNVITKKLIKE